MITFKEMLDRGQSQARTQDLLPQSATEAQAFLACRSATTRPEQDENHRNKMESVTRRRTTIRMHKRDQRLIKMKVVDVHDAMLQQQRRYERMASRLDGRGSEQARSTKPRGRGGPGAAVDQKRLELIRQSRQGQQSEQRQSGRPVVDREGLRDRSSEYVDESVRGG